MMRKTLVAALMGLALALRAMGAGKEPPLPKGLPPYGATKPLAAPKTIEQKLPNGLTLWLVPRPGFPKVTFTLAVRGGMAADPQDLPGVSELLLATIDEGTKTRDAKKIAEDLQAAGGDFSGEALADSLVISASVLASKAEAALALLADVMQNSTFPASEVDLAKRNAADNLRARQAEPSFLADRALAKAVFGNFPYSVIAPTQESIAQADASKLRAEYARRFRPEQALLVAVGDFDAPTMTASVGKLLGGWTGPPEAVVSPLPSFSPPAPHEIFYVERPDSVQTTFLLAALGPTRSSPDYEAAEVANAVYGGMFGSRLINNIREDKGYTYSPGSYLQSRLKAGLLETHADVRNAVTGASFNEIAYELNRMATTEPAQEEMVHARRYLVGLKAIRLQSQGSVARQLAQLWIHGLPPEEMARESERIEQVTARDVETVGQKYFPASRQTIVAVGEEKVIKNQLAPFGLEVKPAP